jgi:hypothetical protein
VLDNAVREHRIETIVLEWQVTAIGADVVDGQIQLLGDPLRCHHAAK